MQKINFTLTKEKTMIRLAKLSDLDTLTEIYNQAILTKRCTADMDTFTSEERMKWFNDHQDEKYPLYVYEINDKVVGYATLSSYRPRRAFEKTVEVSYYIDFDYHRMGIGDALLKHTINSARNLGYKTLIAILLGVNKGSTGLLEKHGFEKYGEIPDIADFGDYICSHMYYGLKL